MLFVHRQNHPVEACGIEPFKTIPVYASIAGKTVSSCREKPDIACNFPMQFPVHAEHASRLLQSTESSAKQSQLHSTETTAWDKRERLFWNSRHRLAQDRSISITMVSFRG
jgi:hypothetical protein